MLRRFYNALPLSPAMRYRVGIWRRRLAGRPVPTGAPLQLPPLVPAAPPPAPVFEPAQADLRDYVFFGVIDWHFRHQRPQQLALALARSGRRVFYVSVNFVEADRAGVSVERIDPVLPVWQIFLQVRGPLSVYTMTPTDAQARQLRTGLRDLWVGAGIVSAVHLIQHPFWHVIAGRFPAARTVYDCMDHHAGFENTAAAHTEREAQLMRDADAVVVSATALAEAAQPHARRVALIRNACDFEHFHGAARHTPARRPVVGYYGAIAEWFDVGLLDALAAEFGHCEFRLVGADTAGVGQALRHRPNVTMHGEVPYAELPSWLADFDVCLIPFRINALTLATNPVKVYEYLSAGKPVVGTDLPELRPFGDLVWRAQDVAGFAAALREALAEAAPAPPPAAAAAEARIALARGQTWAQRAAHLAEVAEDAGDEPLTSVVVLAYHQWPLTERCLASLETGREGAPLQVIVVDNASADETPAQLQRWREADPVHRIVVSNPSNRGFAGGVNDGMAHATGPWRVVLNNDTVVSPGWARGLRRHLEADPGLGIVCAVTNHIGNEAQVALPGRSPAEVAEAARRYTLARAGQCLPMPGGVAFFCVMLHESVWARVGPMDERFFPGFFEDDDYCRRLEALGLRAGCAEDVFVFHELSASFNAESAARRAEIFARNKAAYEAKWGAWTPHVYRAESTQAPGDP